MTENVFISFHAVSQANVYVFHASNFLLYNETS